MKCRLFNITAALSLLLLLATVGLWADSYWYEQAFVHSQNHAYVRLDSAYGLIVYHRGVLIDGEDHPPTGPGVHRVSLSDLSIQEHAE